MVDDPARAAPLSTQAGASLRTRTPEQIEVYSQALGIPADRFGTVDGNIVYRDDRGDLVRVSPSVTGATGPVDAARRMGGVVARNAGDFIPGLAGLVASTGVAVPPTSPITIPLAGALAAAGEYGRQELGDAIYGSRPEGTDWFSVAGQGGSAALGQGIGLGIGRLIEANPAGVTGAADRRFFRDPTARAEAQRLADEGRQEGVTLLAGDVTNRRSLLQRDRQLGRFPDTADDMAAVVQRRNTVEVPGAIDRRIAGSAGNTPSVEGGRAAFTQGARNVIDDAFERMQGLNSPLFQRAWEARPGPVWSEDLDALLRRPAIARAWQEAQTAAANSGRELPPLFRVSADGNRLELVDAALHPDMQAWHQIKRGLDQIVNGGSDPLTGAMRMPGGRDVREARDALRAALVRENPAYGEALAESAPRLQAFADLEATGIARTARREGQGASNEGLAAIFDGAKMAPERVAQYRQSFLDAGQEDAWRAGLSAYLRDAMEAAQKTTQRGEPSNVAGKFYQQVFGTPQRREALAQAMGGAGTQEYQEFARTMRVLQAASRSFPEGSPTATDAGARSGFASGAARAAGGAANALNPLNWPGMLRDVLVEGSAAGNAQRIAQGYLAAGPVGNGEFIPQMRLLPNPVAGLLGGGGQAATAGAAGLLGPLFEEDRPPGGGLLAPAR
ncbi:hypothetical protein [Siccirubricoccus phaeus]|uniref:hypothetical protein n=1 Tax=Siccirubricoccus phaeus TaxID=2595053 RepID=UPI0011F28D10|nr:hypothetical protein [Siccirubricoccus phaeus]